MHQPACRVVDKHQQGALRPTILKPPMLAAIDLDQFADAVAAWTGLVNPFQALLAVDPQTLRDHPLAQRLARPSGNPVQLDQLLGRQGRAEIAITFANDRQRLVPDRLGMTPVARLAATARNQTRAPGGLEGSQQPEDLTAADPQNRRRCRRRQTACRNIAYHIDPAKLLCAHHHQRHQPVPPAMLNSRAK